MQEAHIGHERFSSAFVRTVFYALLLTTLAVGVTGCEWWRSPASLALKNRMEARWTALDTAKRAISSRPDPALWSGGVFIGTTTLAKTLEQLEGFKLEYAPTDGVLSGVTVELTKAVLKPHYGFSEAEITLEARRGEMQFAIQMSASVAFAGVVPSSQSNAKDTALALFRIDPLTLVPALKVGPLQIQEKQLWSKLAPDLALAFADPKIFEIKLPIKDTFRLNLGLDTVATETINKDTGATLTYRMSMPETTVEQKLTFSPPIFRPEGVWLLAALTESGQEQTLPRNAPALPTSELATLVGEMEKEHVALTERFTGDRETVSAWLGKDVLIGLGAKLADIPDANRMVTVQSTAYTGRLTETKWKDDLLGDGGAFAELNGADRLRSTIAFGKPAISWDTSGLRLSLPVKADIEASVKVHFDPLIGGGMGTTLGLVGNGGGTVGGSATTKIINSSDLAVALTETVLACDAITASIATDGRLKIDLAWIKVPQVGAKLEFPLGREPVGATALLDNRPIFIELPAYDPRSESDAAKRAALLAKNPWAMLPKVPALKVRILPKAFEQRPSGFQFTVGLETTPIQTERTRKALDEAQRSVQLEAASIEERVKKLIREQPKVTACTGEPTFAILFGAIEFGSNNDIAKFAKNAWNDMTKGPGPNNELRKLVASVEKAVPSVHISTGGSHGGLGVTVGKWKF